MPLFEVTHNEEKSYVFADSLSDAMKRWATAEAKKTGDDPNAFEPKRVTWLADDNQIIASNENGEPEYASGT